MSASTTRLAVNEPGWLRICSSTHIFLLCCAWLVVLTVVGTLAQRDLGLYLAQHRYFTAWFIMVGGVLPLPGGTLTMSVVFLNLLAFLFTHRGVGKPGLFIVHSGVLLLIGGAFIAGFFRFEGSMALRYDEPVDEMQLFHKHELVVMEFTDDDTLVTIFGEGLLQPGEKLQHEALPFPLQVQAYLANCRTSSDGSLEALPVETDFEVNNAGVILDVDGQEITSHPRQADWARLQRDDRSFAIGLRKARRPLPVGVELLEFKHDKHPGTEMASAYASTVMLHEGPVTRRVLITMNEPLRYGGWTFYQQSYFPMPNDPQGREGSVLQVVHDRVAWYPFVATIIMCIGLFLHLVTQLPRLFAEREVSA